MEDIYTFEVVEEELSKIISAKKDIQLVINDSKRKSLAIGNVITFKLKELQQPADVETSSTDVESKVDSVTATIENLLFFNSIEEAVGMLGKERCGFKPSATFDKATDQFLSSEKYEMIEKNGLMAIIFKLN